VLNQPTLEKLTTMRLHALAEAWQEQAADRGIASLSFDERLALLVDVEWLSRQNKRIARALREAKLRLSNACIEDIEYPASRKLDRAVILQLATCRWIDEHHNVVLTGATGVGKTYIACALAHQAIRRGYRALYRRASRLFDELALARADGSYAKVLRKIARADVLVLDDWALVQIGEAERRDLSEVMEDRHGLKSTIITSQFPVAKWHDHIGDPTIADAICDRLVHNAHRIDLKGPSRRKTKNLRTKKS
jgi:DNA replication protein DnaC